MLQWSPAVGRRGARDGAAAAEGFGTATLIFGLPPSGLLQDPGNLTLRRPAIECNHFLVKPG